MEENRCPTLSSNCTEMSTADVQSLSKRGAVDTFYLKAATRPNTRKAYQSDIQQFIAWGGVLPASPELIMRYLHEQAPLLNPRTLSRRLVALGRWHQYQGFPNPAQHQAIQKTLRGIYNTHGKPKDTARPLTLDQLELLVNHLQRQIDLASLRNLVLLQVGFMGSLRRSELVGIQLEHIAFVKEGLEIMIPRSKTDPQGEGQLCAIPYGNDKLCAVKALKVWLAEAGITSGAVFRAINKHGHLHSNALSADSVNVILKKLAKKCGLEEYHVYRGHSLRRGFVTAAIKKGASIPGVMKQGRWKDVKTVMGYFEEVQRFEENAVNVLFKT